MEGAHDLGGMSGFGAIRSADGDLSHHESWELRAQLLALIACGGARAWIERIDTPTYLSTSYYGRWLLAAEMAVVARGTASADELAGWRGRIEAGEAIPVVHDSELRARVELFMNTPAPAPPATSPSFVLGEAVRVRRIYAPDVHHRIPRYVRGALGVVESICGDERVAGHRQNDYEPFYTVRFDSTVLWGESDEPPFAVHVDFWQSSLERAA